MLSIVIGISLTLKSFSDTAKVFMPPRTVGMNENKKKNRLYKIKKI